MRIALLLVVVVGTSCSKQDDCRRFVDKSRSVLDGMMKAGGKELSSSDLDQLVEKCRTEKGKPGNKDDALMKCVLDAKDDPAIATCWSAAFGDYRSKSKKTEAQLQLSKLGKNLKVYYATEEKFPAGKAGPTPAKPCCEAGGKCPVTDAWTKDPVWAALDFQIDEPNLFQYAYDSDGKTVTATAIGDLDCDGTAITYTLNVTVDASGNPTSQITDPPPDAD